MLKISWKDKVTNSPVPEKANKDRSMLNTIWQRKQTRFVHVFRNDVLLREIIEGIMKGKAFQGRKRLHMLSDLTSSAKYVEVKRDKGQQKIKKDGEL